MRIQAARPMHDSAGHPLAGQSPWPRPPTASPDVTPPARSYPGRRGGVFFIAFLGSGFNFNGAGGELHSPREHVHLRAHRKSALVAVTVAQPVSAG